MKIDLTKIGVKKEVEVRVTPKMIRYVLVQNKRSIVDTQTLFKAGKQDMSKMSDDQSIDSTLNIFDAQIDSIDVMEEALKTVFKLSDKQVDHFLDMDFEKAQSAYQDVMGRVLGGNTDDEKGKDDPKAK